MEGRERVCVETSRREHERCHAAKDVHPQLPGTRARFLDAAHQATHSRRRAMDLGDEGSSPWGGPAPHAPAAAIPPLTCCSRRALAIKPPARRRRDTFYPVHPTPEREPARRLACPPSRHRQQLGALGLCCPALARPPWPPQAPAWPAVDQARGRRRSPGPAGRPLAVDRARRRRPSAAAEGGRLVAQCPPSPRLLDALAAQHDGLGQSRRRR
jgi:hypothetical protein